MKSKKIALFSCATLVAVGIGLNIQNALADYGIGENSLSLVAGPGSNSGSNSNSNWNSNTNTGPWDESDSAGLTNEEELWSKATGTEVHCTFSGEPGEVITFSFNGTTYTCTVGDDHNAVKDVPYNTTDCWHPGTIEDCVLDLGPNPQVISRSKH